VEGILVEINPCCTQAPSSRFAEGLDFLISDNLLGPLSSGIEAASFEFEYEIEKGRSEGELKRKPAKSGRKSTLVLRPHHPDLQPAIDSLISGTLLTAATDIVEAASLVFDEYEVEEGDEDPYDG
jgi:hypothetical protein